MRQEIFDEIYDEVEHILSCYDAEDDLEQELWVSLLQKPEEKIEELYSRGELLYYICGAIKTLKYSPKGDFQRKFKRFESRTVPIDEMIEDYV